MNDRVRTNPPTPTEKLALKTANAALLESNNAFCDMVATVVFALGDAQLLQSPETAAELATLRIRVTELEAERHTTNEWVNDAATALRTAGTRVAELETVAVEARAALGNLCYDLEDPGTAALGALHLLSKATLWTDTGPDFGIIALAKRDADVLRRAASFVRDTYDGEWADDAAATLEHDADQHERQACLPHPTAGELAEQRHLVDELDHALEALAPRNHPAAGGVL